MAKVFSIPELFEHILLQLCSEDRGVLNLYYLQRTNHAFQDAILGSLQLHRLMGSKQEFTDVLPARNAARSLLTPLARTS